MKFSIVTPSYRQVTMLRCCAASVQDQIGDFEVEHLIRDGGSGGAFDEWAASQSGAVCVSEKDDGMYDAINRGFRAAKGDIIAWLNCDEQYLPNALQQVAQYFQEHPEVDILFGDVILVDELMTPLAYRRAVKPSLGHIRHSHLSTFSAATFVRRKVLDEGHFLQTRWQTIADAVWIEELLAAGYRAGTLEEPLAAFCMLGSNLGQSTQLFKERVAWERETGSTDRLQKKLHIWKYRIERLKAGAYRTHNVKVSAHVDGSKGRLTQTRWISGRWKTAKVKAENFKSKREGAFSGLKINSRSTLATLGHAAVVFALAFYINGMAEGDAVKGPPMLMFSLMYLSFRSKLRDLIWVVLLYSFGALYLLSELPSDVMVARFLTFAAGASLGLMWSASLRNLEEWVKSTVALIRKIPGAMILTDRVGRMILVNQAACARLKDKEEVFLKKELFATSFDTEGRQKEPLKISDWEERPPDGVVGLSFKDAEEPQERANVFVIGRGRYRFYAFMLNG